MCFSGVGVMNRDSLTGTGSSYGASPVLADAVTAGLVLMADDRSDVISDVTSP